MFNSHDSVHRRTVVHLSFIFTVHTSNIKQGSLSRFNQEYFLKENISGSK